MMLPALTFVAILALILGGYWFLVLQPEQATHAALRRRLGDAGVTEAVTRLDVVKTDDPLSSVPMLERALKQTAATSSKLQALINSSGTKLTVGSFVLATLFFAALGFGIVYRYVALVAPAVLFGVMLAFVPFLYLRYQRSKRLSRFEEQFPEAIDLIARAMRAGHAFTTGLGMAADEIAAPAGTEFRLLYDWQNYGMGLPEALRRFADRVPILDARFFVTAVLIQRESGGNLSEVLDNLSKVIRERFRVKRQVRVVSAHGRITGVILSVLPLFLAISFFSMSPEHITTMVTDPMGIRMVVGAAILQVIGALAIRRITDVEY